MRLIDADALIEFIDAGHLRHHGELVFSELDVVNMLQHAPTAYKQHIVEDEIEQLKLDGACITILIAMKWTGSAWCLWAFCIPAILE